MLMLISNGCRGSSGDGELNTREAEKHFRWPCMRSREVLSMRVQVRIVYIERQSAVCARRRESRGS